MQINRLFEIVYILLDKQSITARELAEHFEVSQRTIYRDIDTLSQAGIPVYANRGKGGGICLMENFVLNKSLLTKQEQNEILSALQGVRITNYTEVSSTLNKLSSLFKADNQDWIEVDFSNWNSTDEDKTKFNLLKDAILSRKVISFTYYNSYGLETNRIVEPVKLVFRAQAWYLSGYCRDKQDYRYFKITRIKNLMLTNEIYKAKATPISEPKASSEAMHTEEYDKPIDKSVLLKLKMDASMAFRIYDEFPRDSISKQEDGSFIIQSPMQSNNWLYGYLLSFEDQIEVLEPAYVRDELINKINNLKKIYKA